jgi:hypothetical protein
MEEEMAQKLMSEKEKAAITMRFFALRDEGKEDEAMTLFKTIPMPPFLAKITKEKMGAEYLNGWNLAGAEAKFGSGWLNQCYNQPYKIYSGI